MNSADELRTRGVSETVIAWRRWRRNMRLSQTEAAAMADVHPRTIEGMERGEHPPRRSTLRKLHALMARWDESRYPRKPERRGAHNRGRAFGYGVKGARKAQPMAASKAGNT